MEIPAISRCRICGNPRLTRVLDLGVQALSGRFPKANEPDPPRTPLRLVKCDDGASPSSCGLVQLEHSVPPDEMYRSTYGYRSGINKSMSEHLARLSEEVTRMAELKPGEVVLDIGSNDATLLKSYKTSGLVRIGIDPTAAQFASHYPPDIRLVSDFFNAKNFNNALPSGKAKAVTSIAMFYDLEDPLAFAKDVREVLAGNGIWVLEQSYMPTMLERNAFDTVCQEHLEYYSLKQVEWILKKCGMKALSIELNDVNGGSFRIVAAPEGSAMKADEASLGRARRRERDLSLDTAAPYEAFARRVDDIKIRLVSHLKSEKAKGRRIFVYGASTKGNVLLHYYGIDKTLVDGAAERNPEKWGSRTPGTNIPILSEEEARKKADIFLVLPYHFRREFMEREATFLKGGGSFVFPLPEPAEVFTDRTVAL